MAKPVLVTSAAGGRQGKTGRHVSEMLLARGVPVRAFVHTIEERSEHLRALGAEVFEGDFLDAGAVQRAAQGTSAIYFAYPVQDGLLDATAAMAPAARKAGVSRLVNLVMLESSIDAPTPRMRQNYLSEQVFEWAGIGAVDFRPRPRQERALRGDHRRGVAQRRHRPRLQCPRDRTSVRALEGAPRRQPRDTIEKIGGATPKTFEQFVREGLSESLAKSA
jgi:uncharacterized protein YbjT (DUF2867 family)